jgi:hypothetical protein
MTISFAALYGRHVFFTYLDRPSVAPTGPPRHRAPKHRADVPVDSCVADRSGVPCYVCAEYDGERVAS